MEKEKEEERKEKEEIDEKQNEIKVTLKDSALQLNSNSISQNLAPKNDQKS